MEMMNDETALPRSTGYRCGACCAPVGEPHFAGCMMASVDAAAGLAADMLDQLDHSRLPLAVTAAVGVLRTALARAAVSAATKPTADLTGICGACNGSGWANAGCVDPCAQCGGQGAEVGEAAKKISAIEADILQVSRALTTSADQAAFSRIVSRLSLLATKPAAAPAVPEELTPMLLLNAALLIEGDQFASTVSAAKKASIVDKLGRVADWLAAVRKSPAASTTGAAQTAEQVRDQALEDAAKVCADADKNEHPADLAVAIRALKRPTPTEGEQA